MAKNFQDITHDEAVQGANLASGVDASRDIAAIRSLTDVSLLRRAARKEARRIAALPSISHLVVVFQNELDLVAVEIDGVTIKGDVKNFNKIVERLGYRPVRLTRNMLNPASPTFAIDIDTPSYCDPGCESYHSM